MPEIFKNTFKSVVTSLYIPVFCVIVMSFTMLYIDLPQIVIEAISYIIIALFCYESAYKSTQTLRNKGLVQGLICGVMVYIILFLCSILFLNFEITISAIAKLVVCILLGAIGGIRGVNTKKTFV